MLRIIVLFVLLALATSACVFHSVDPNIPYRYADSGELPPLPGEDGVDEPDIVPPVCDMIKGNISSDGRKLYFAPGDRNYNQVKINESKGEMFFCDVPEAETAGWVHASNQ
jgi:hypothetical protein